MSVFHVFQIVQMIPNCAKRVNYTFIYGHFFTKKVNVEYGDYLISFQ